MKSLQLIFLSLVIGYGANAQPLPGKLFNHWELMTKESGIWIADNSAFQSEQEPYDAYGLQWKWGIGQQNIQGELFGLIKGEKQGVFWQFRQYWHPGKQKAYVVQYGSDGSYGVGEFKILENGETELLQTFYSPNGNTWQTGHKSTTNERVHTSVSYRIENSNWIENRTYRWEKKLNK